MIKYIVMHCGYAESSYTSALIYQCQFFGKDGYATAKEAITDLAVDLYNKFYDDHLSVVQNKYSKDVKKCCREVLTANEDAKFCSTCGSPISDRKFDYEEFQEYVSGLHCTTADSYGEAEYANGNHLNWWPYWTKDFIGASKEEIVYIGENAEVVLIEALLDAKPELKDEDQDDFYSSDWEEFKKK